MRRLCGVLAAVLLATVWTATGAAAESGCPVDYLAAVGQARAALSETPPDTSTAVNELRGTVVAYPSSAQTLTPALQLLRKTPPDVAQARSRLDTIASTLAFPYGTTCNADQRPALSTLRGVYASPVFANLDSKPAGPNPITQFLSWLGSALRWLLSHLTGALGTAGSIALGAVVLAAALLFAAWRLRGVLASRAAVMAAGAAPDTDDPDLEWTFAAAAAQRRDYREAIRRAFRSALLTVAVRGRLGVDPSWTTHELLAATVGDAQLLAALAPAAALFDRAWYSGAQVTAGDWEQARARCASVRELARAKTPAEPR